MNTRLKLSPSDMSTLSKQWREGRPVDMIALELGMDENEVRAHAQNMGLRPRDDRQQRKETPTVEQSSKVASASNATPYAQRAKGWPKEKIERFKEGYADKNMSIEDLAEELGSSRGALYVRARAMGLPPRKKGRAPGRSKNNGDSQRRFKSTLPSERRQAPPKLDECHPAIRNGATIYGKSVIPASKMERLLKSGEHNRKIGKVCTKGRWKGMPIYTLTLEERATCPRSCEVWATCYGNSMGQTNRIHDDGWLNTKLFLEMVLLAQSHPEGFIVRLHVLGDFFSTDYVKFWDDALTIIPQLHIFGFTARLPDTDIGRALVCLMQGHLDQVAMRWSGWKGPLHGSEVIKREEDAIGIVCPAQKDVDRCCATCALCWNSEHTISFLEH